MPCASRYLSRQVDGVALFSLISGAVGILGFGFAVYTARRSERRKLLTYGIRHVLPLANVFPNERPRLSVVYEASGAAPVQVRGAYLIGFAMANLGREPIRRADIAESDPLRLEVRGSRVLDISEPETTHPAMRLTIEPPQVAEDGTSSARISFDHLDYFDGASVRILTEDHTVDVRLAGYIVGMPDGIKHVSELGPRKLRSFTGLVLSGLLYIAALAGAAWLFNTFVRDWSLWWVLLLPIGVLFLPAVLIIFASLTFWPAPIHWPHKLGRLPDWPLRGHRGPHYPLLDHSVVPPPAAPNKDPRRGGQP